MSQMWRDMQHFHEKFLLPQCEVPSILEKELHEFRFKFMHEELEEFEDACERKDLVKAFDALIDLVYVAMGTAYLMNLPWDEGWLHVQTANMAKVRAKHKGESSRGSTYDVIKPEGWVAPEKMLLAEVLTHEHHLLIAKNDRLRLEKLRFPTRPKMPEGADGCVTENDEDTI